MRNFYNKRLISLLFVLALIVACGFGFAVPASAVDSPQAGETVPIGEMPEYAGYDCIAGCYITNSDASGGVVKVGVYVGGELPSGINIDYINDRFVLVADLSDASASEACYVIKSPFLTVNYPYIEQNTILGNKLLLSVGEMVTTDDGMYIFFDYTGEIGATTEAQFEFPGNYSFVVYGSAVPLEVAPPFTDTIPMYLQGYGPNKAIEGVSVSPSASAPYYPGASVQMQAVVTGNGDYDSSVTWSVESGLSGGVTIDENGLLYIPTDEQALSVEVIATSVADPNISGSYTVDITYPLQGVSIVPSGQDFYPFSSKDRTIQYSLLLPNGDPYDYELLMWIIEPTAGAAGYYTVDDTGLVTIKGGAPVGSGYILKWAYVWDTDNPAPDSVSLSVVSNQEAIQDQLTPTPEQSDKADRLEDQIGDAADKLENNNSSLGQLTPTGPQINTNLEFDQDQMLAVSPLVTNIWSINGLGRMISIVLVVATVAYIFFGKRDG